MTTELATHRQGLPSPFVPQTSGPATFAHVTALGAPAVAVPGYDGPQYGMIQHAAGSRVAARPQLVAYRPMRYRYRIRWENVIPLLVLCALIAVAVIGTKLLTHSHAASTGGSSMAGMDMTGSGTGTADATTPANPAPAATTTPHAAKTARHRATQKRVVPATKKPAAHVTAAPVHTTTAVSGHAATTQAAQHHAAPVTSSATHKATTPAHKKAPGAPIGGGATPASTKPSTAISAPPAGHAPAGAPPSAPGGPASTGAPQTPMSPGMTMPAGTQ